MLLVEGALWSEKPTEKRHPVIRQPVPHYAIQYGWAIHERLHYATLSSQRSVQLCLTSSNDAYFQYKLVATYWPADCLQNAQHKKFQWAIHQKALGRIFDDQLAFWATMVAISHRAIHVDHQGLRKSPLGSLGHLCFSLRGPGSHGYIEWYRKHANSDVGSTSSTTQWRVCFVSKNIPVLMIRRSTEYYCTWRLAKYESFAWSYVSSCTVICRSSCFGSVKVTVA